jgi:hypothetical protein
MIRDTAGEMWLYGMAEFGYATDDAVPAILARATARGCRVQLHLDGIFPPGERRRPRSLSGQAGQNLVFTADDRCLRLAAAAAADARSAGPGPLTPLSQPLDRGQRSDGAAEWGG